MRSAAAIRSRSKELSGALDADQLAGHRALPELASVGARLEGVYASRARRLPSATQEALLVLAVSGENATHVRHAYPAPGGLDLAALHPAENAGLVEMRDGIVRFRHPTVRSAIYHAAGAVERRRAHAAVAATFPDSSAERAGHLAAAAIGIDEAVAAQLETVAWRAVRRSGFATASNTFERAARLSEFDDTRARRLIEAAQAAVRAGDSRRAHGLAASAEPSPENTLLRGEMLALQGHLAHLGGDAGAVEMLARAASLVAGDDPGRAVTILVNAAESCVFTGRHNDLQLLAQRIVVLSQPDDPRQQFFAHLTSGTACVATGDHDEGVGHAEQAMHLVTAGLPAFEDPHHLAWTAIAPASLGRFDIAMATLRDVIVQLRELGAVGTLPFALRFSARVALQTGRWRDAYIAVSEA